MASRLVLAVAVGIFVIAGLDANAFGFSQPIGTTLSVIKPGKLYKMVSKGTFLLPAGNPADEGGYFSVEHFASRRLVCDLPNKAYDGTEGWKGLGRPAGSKGWKYLNKLAPAGGWADPCKVVIIKENVIKVLAKGTGDLEVHGAGWNSELFMKLNVVHDYYFAETTPPYAAEIAGVLLKIKDEPINLGSDGDGIPSPFDPCVLIYNRTVFGLGDNGDGTVTDSMTCLMWEKKDSEDWTPNPANLHDADNTYSWAGCCGSEMDCYFDEEKLCQPNAAAAAACSSQTGGVLGCSECSVGTCDVDPGHYGAITTIWDWLVQVKAEAGSGYAGHSDWRLPSGDLCDGYCRNRYTEGCCYPEELETILLEPYPCGSSPCIDPIFGPTGMVYWTGSHPPLCTQCIGVEDACQCGALAWAVIFYDGSVQLRPEALDSNCVRAVRGGMPVW